MNIGFFANLMCVPEAFCFDLEPHCYKPTIMFYQAWAQDQAHRPLPSPRGRSLAARWSLASLGTVR